MSGDVLQYASPDKFSIMENWRGSEIMENIVIIIIPVIVAGIGVCSTVKHFKGQGGCCGGSGYTRG